LPGLSGNPAGRPKVVAEIRGLARQHVPAAFRRICELVRTRDERVALAASQAILDRAYGRPVQAVQSEVKKRLSRLGDIPLAAKLSIGKQ
jgi:hypothetical protein